jgi:RNA 2',3'-cyclic 3'-phosphodiesterase
MDRRGGVFPGRTPIHTADRVNPRLSVPGRLRTFVAVEIPGDLLKALETVQSELRRRGMRARWTRPESMHLTLKFLGNIPADHVAGVTDALQSAAAGHAAFRLTAAGIGVFPGVRRPRVVWAGLSGATAALARLQRELDDSLAAVGFAREERGFHGHLTLGRFAEGVDGGLIAEGVAFYASATFGDFEVCELVLFQSDLQPRGPVYRALARAKLRPPLES